MSGNHRTAKALGRPFTPANLVYVHGAFAAPFLNWILTSDLDDAWRNYYKTLRYTWQRQYEKALRAVETGLRQCTQSSTLHYLLLAKKLSCLEHLHLPGSRALYQRLRHEYERIPLRARPIVTSVLLNCHALLQEPLPQLTNVGHFRVALTGCRPPAWLRWLYGSFLVGATPLSTDSLPSSEAKGLPGVA